jgi:hypothetical protein
LIWHLTIIFIKRNASLVWHIKTQMMKKQIQWRNMDWSNYLIGSIRQKNYGISSCSKTRIFVSLCLCWVLTFRIVFLVNYYWKREEGCSLEYSIWKVQTGFTHQISSSITFFSRFVFEAFRNRYHFRVHLPFSK